MEAIDTVLAKQRLDEIDAKNAESNFIDALFDVAREQAEISFNAGIKEVVDWINSNRGESIEWPVFTIEMADWQSKLKSWNISE